MIIFSENRDIESEQVIAIYQSNGWSSAQKPQLLYQALLNSHHLVSAWDDKRLIGICNAISDGFLVVYYPHLLVHPDYQGKGIGKKLIETMKKRYEGFHMQVLVADAKSISFYEKCGFVRAGKTEAMWIYDGKEH
jgi:GNAT superfamily N-acetyltransferase